MGDKFSGLDSLIIVPGHAICVGTEPAHAEKDEFWIGGFPGEGIFYAQHADAGVQEAAKNKTGLLVFSGGQTREKAGPMSEAQSYWRLADQKKWLGYEDVRGRATTEEFARNSLENLAFGISRFKQCVGSDPQKIIVCGWGFKKERYEAHCQALGFHLERFSYVAVNNPEGSPDDLSTPYGKAMAGEKKTLDLFKISPRGTEGELLETKMKRDPFKRGNPYSF